MPTTPKLALRYPAAADPADVPTDMAELATDLDNAVLPITLIDAKGDMIVGSAADTAVRKAVGTDGQWTVDAASPGGVKWATPAAGGGGQELAYAAYSATLNVTALAEPSANTIVTTGAVACDGNPVLVSFQSPGGWPWPVIGGYLMVAIFMDGTTQGMIAWLQTPAAATNVAPLSGSRRITPAAGNHTFSARAWVSSDSGNVSGPGFIRVTKV